MKKIWYVFIVILFITFNSFILKAQYGSFGATDAQTIGIGNSFGSAFGTLALGKNPALLDYPKDTTRYFAIQIPNFAFKAIETSMSLDDFNNYFNYPEARNLNDKERQEFFEAFGDNNSFYFNAGSKLLALAWKPSETIGTFAFSMTDYAAGTLKIPLTMVDLIINGNAENSNYEFDDFAFNVWWIRNYTLSYAREIYKFKEDEFIKNLTGGISIKYIMGFAYSGIEEFSANLKTGEYNALSGKINYLARSAFSPDLGVEYDFDDSPGNDDIGLFPTPAGFGLGFDIGFAADLDYHLRVGLAITDIGSITWDKKTAEFKAKGEIEITDLFDKDQQNNLENFLNDSSYSISSFSTSLPTALRLSIAYELSKSIGAIPGDLTVQLGYNQGFNNMPGNSTTPRVALGARWKTKPYIPVIYTGFSNNRAGDIVWTMGLGFSTSVLDFAIATQDVISLFNTSGSPHISAAMNFVWRIEY